MLTALLKILAPSFKQMGFSKSGNSFHLKSGENYGIFNFQKSTKSTKETVFFTINFGVYSNTLGAFDFDRPTKLDVYSCHWQSRVGAFMPGSPDYWWEIDITDDLVGIAANVLKAVEDIVIPEIHKRLSDDDLISCWLYEKDAGNTAIGRFKGLTILLKTKGDIKTLKQVVEVFMQESRGRPSAGIALAHLKSMGYEI